MGYEVSKQNRSTCYFPAISENQETRCFGEIFFF